MAKSTRSGGRKGPSRKAQGRVNGASKTKRASNPVRLHGGADPIEQALVRRAVNVTTERRGLLDDLREIYSEAKGKGYDTKVMRASVKVLCESSEQRSERLRVEEERDLQLHRLGDLADTPLGRAAIAAVEGRSALPDPGPMPMAAAADAAAERPTPDFC
jgi:uncharacterized protein (UPF0335 family)